MSSQVYSDSSMIPDNNYVDETTLATNLIENWHGDAKTYSAVPIPNYYMEQFITEEETSSTKRKAENTVESPKKRPKNNKKSTVAGKQTSKSTTVKLDKRNQQPKASTSTEIQAMQSTNLATETRTFENLYDFNRVNVKKKQQYTLLMSSANFLDSQLRKCEEFEERENLMKENGLALCKITSSETKNQLVEMKQYYIQQAQDYIPDICLVCKSDTPSVIGSCGHCFICFKCFVSYLNQALANSITSTSCLKCKQIVNTTMFSS